MQRHWRVAPTICVVVFIRNSAVRLLAALFLFCLTGCNSSINRPNNTVSRTADGKILLNFWNGFTGPDGRAMEKMVARFQERNPDVAVQMQIIPWGTYYDKLTLSLAYGGAPDVFVMHAGRLPEFASFDTLKPLNDLFQCAQPPLSEKEFAPVPWQASFYQNQQYALPLDVHPIGLYYNTRLFKEAGIVDKSGNVKPPRNLE